MLAGCPWSVGRPRCGDNALDAGEACDPPGAVAQCPAGESCKAGCTCAPACDCCASAPTRLIVSHRPTAGKCGKITYANGMTRNLDCGTLYFGGGGNSIPHPFLPEITSTFAVTKCDPVTETLTLGPTMPGTTSACTADGCVFGAPVAIPNANSTPTSSCLLLQVGAGTTGSSSCDGMLSVLMPLKGRLFLTGDALPLESCEQRTQGAFGPGGGAADLIELIGTPSGCLANRAQHSATTVAGICVVPTYNATVDSAADLPGPAACSLTGGLQLQ